ncbi:MAG: TonB family protein [Candidatus Dadabacteria bacterium]|nr:TonB family protein [Candidatus Dadabacteria bacterium]
MRYILAVVAALFFLPYTSFSIQLYRWEDVDGNSHYTTSLHKIPQRYRAVAEEVETDESSVDTGAAAVPRHRNSSESEGEKSYNNPMYQYIVPNIPKKRSLLDTTPPRAHNASTYDGAPKDGDYLASNRPGVSVPKIYKTVSLNTREFRYFPYFVRLKRKIEDVWQYPMESRLAREQGTLELVLILTAKGKVLDVVVVKSTPYERLNREVVRSVREAGPFHRFPPEWRERGLQIRLEFAYLLDYWWQKTDSTRVSLRKREPTFEDIRSEILGRLEVHGVVNDVRLEWR